MTETAPNVDHGPGDLAAAHEILRTVVGSGVHGIAIEGTDDHDEMGVFIEPAEYVASIAAWDYEHNRVTHAERTGVEHHIFRTQAEGARSGPGDTDRVMYSLRKFARLAAKGNPTVLLPLFAPPESIVTMTDAGYELRKIRGAFLSQHAVHRFLRYMEAQHERMLGGGRQGRVPNRPELVKAHGYDTKYASHALRLAIQGYEVASTGHLTLPLPEPARDAVMSVKTGHWARDDVSEAIWEYEGKVDALLTEGKCPLPVAADWDTIDATLIRLHLNHWGLSAGG